MKLVRCLVFILLSCLVYGQAPDATPCVTPTREDGLCVIISQCPNLMDKIKKAPVVREHLKTWQCGFVGREPKVCCLSVKPNVLSITTNTTTTTTTTATTTPAMENHCVTRFGTNGTCIKIQQCPSLLRMMKTRNREDLDFVQRSRCTGEGVSVCCDDILTDRYAQSCPQTAEPPKPGDFCCGVENNPGNKIIGGTETAIDQYPWLALITYNPKEYSCGGTLISSLYVLTAAHCLVTSKGAPKGANSVILGEYNRTNIGEDCVLVEGGGRDCTDGNTVILIEKVIPHEKFNMDNTIYNNNDIGLIKLVTMAPFTDFIRPLCLPTTDLTQNHPSNWRLLVAGWGVIDDFGHTSNVKLHTTVPYVEQKTCRERYSTNGKTSVWDKQICAGGEAGMDSCRGDSGGPLMHDNENFYEIIGIVSFGPTQCGTKGRPSIYTKVYEYLDWIKINTGN